MVSEFVEELNQEQFKVVGTRNIPNNLFDEVDWFLVDDLKEKLMKLQTMESHEDLNRVDLKSKKLNQKYRKAAIKEAVCVFDDEIIRVAGLIDPNHYRSLVEVDGSG